MKGRRSPRLLLKSRDDNLTRMTISWPTVLVSLVVQLIVAWATVQLALGRFRQEKWWERKYEAYSEMLTALHLMKRSLLEPANFDLRDREPTDEQKAKWKADFQKGSAEVARHTDLGDFLLSNQACKAIRRFGEAVRVASNSRDHNVYIEDNLAATDQLIEDLKAEAKRDLGVRRDRREPSSAREPKAL